MGLYSRLRSALSALHDGGYDFFSLDGKSNDVEARDYNLGAYYSNAFRGCLLAKARPLSSLPVRVYERDGDLRVMAGHPFAVALGDLLRHKWNPFMTGAEGIRWLMVTKDVLGEAFARVQYGADGLPVAIWPMSGAPTIGVDNGGSPVFRYGGDKFTQPGNYLESEVIWVKSPLLDSDGIHGRSLAELAANEIGLSLDLSEFYSHMINGEGNFPGWLETDQQLNAQGFNRLVDQLKDGGGVLKAGKIRIFDNGVHYKTTTQSMVDLNLVEQERWALLETCRTLSVPPQEVFELSNATYSNIEQGALNFANKTLVPECVALETAFSGVLWAAGLTDCYVQLDMNGLLRGSYKERMDGYRVGIYSGVYSPNEVRAKEDMAPYEGGDEFMRSTAYSTVNPETGEVTPAVTANNNASPLPGGNGDSQRDDGGPGDAHAMGTALAVVHADMARRVRERFEDKGDSDRFRDFAGRVLAPMAEACAAEGIEYDVNSDIEEIING